MIPKDVQSKIKLMSEYMSEYVRDTLHICVETADDYAYVEGKLHAGNHPFHAVASLRNRKLKVQQYDFSVFEQDYNTNPVTALQRLFLHPVSRVDVNRVQRYIPEKMTLKELYDLHSNSTKHLLRLLPRGREHAS